jgi:hypothetical protein
MSKTFCQEVEGGKKLFPCRFIAFFAVSLHEELKNTTQMFSKIRPGHLKPSQKKVGRYVIAKMFPPCISGQVSVVCSALFPVPFDI